MKKFLSLVLAMIMVMSLVTVGAGATFTDDADIEYVEAVELMSALGILSGYEGAFNPNGTLTRGAAAKIIAYISQGADIASTMTYGGEYTFSDVPATSSTAPYIAWCAENGIINGHTDGTFRRQDPVSGYAFLKMVLNAMGHYGTYTGAGWQIRVADKAVSEGLLAGIEDGLVNGTDLTRELAAQIAFNALNGTCSAKDGYLVGTKYFASEIEAMTYISIMKTEEAPKYVYVKGGNLLKNAHKVEAGFTGVVTENSANKQTALTTVKAADGTTKTFGVNTGLELLGSNVTFYYKDNSAKEDFAKTGYTYVAGVENGTAVTITGATTKAALKTALAGVGITKNEEVAAKTVTVLNADGTVGTTTLGAITLGTTTGETVVGNKTDSLTLIVVDKAIVGIKKELTKSIEKIGVIDTTANKLQITVGSTAVKNGYKETDNTVTDLINEYEGIAQNDIVILTKIGDIYNVAKAETVTGKPTQIGTNGTVTIDGVAYPKKGTDNVVLTNEKAASEMLFDKEYTLYLDGQGNYITATLKTTATEKTTVFFVEKYSLTENTTYGTATTWYAQCVTMDGTVASFKVSAETAVALTQRTYQISANTKGIYSFTETGVAGDTVIAATDKAADAHSGEGDDVYYYAADVKFIAVKEDVPTPPASKDLSKLKTEVRTGVQAVGGTTPKTTYFIATAEKKADGTLTGNYTVNTVIFAGAFDAVTESLKDIVYAVETTDSTVKVPYTDAAGEVQTGYQHTVYVDGVKTTIITPTNTKLNGFLKLTKAGTAYTTDTAVEPANIDLTTAEKVTNVYGTLITTAGTGDNAAKDIDAANAEIIDLTGATTKVTTIAGLKDKYVALVIDKTDATDKAAVTIYVVKVIN